MAHKSEDPAATGSTRDLLAGFSRFPSTLDTIRAQHLIARGVRADLAPIVAVLAFDGGAHG